MLESEIIKKIGSIHSDSSVQEAIHRRAVLINEFVRGNQWIYVVENGTVTEIPRDEKYFREHRKYRNRETVNIMFPIWRTMLAYYLKTMPRFVGKPQSPDDITDVLAAQVGSTIMDFLYDDLVVQNLGIEIFGCLLGDGTVFLHPYYDQQRSCVDIAVIPPSQIYFYPKGATRWNQVRGVLWRRRVNTELLRNQYPKNADEILDSARSDEAQLAEVQNPQEEEGMTNLNDYWELPGEKHEGFMTVSTDDMMLFFAKKFPYENKDNPHLRYQLPFFGLYENWMPGCLYGFPTLGLVMSRQQAYNVGKSKLADLRDILPKLLIDKRSRIDPEKMYSADSLYLEYDSQGGACKTPQYSSPAILSPSLIKEANEIPQEIEHTTGLHETWLYAQAPGSVQSGYGIERLQEKDEMRLHPSLEFCRIGLTNAFNYLYFLVKERYSTKKIKEILGEMGELDTMVFYDVPLKPMTFKIQTSTYSPFAQISRQAKITQLLSQGLVPKDDPKVIREILRYYDPELADQIDFSSRDYKLQRMENYQMLQGQDVDVTDNDLDDVHIEAMDPIRKHPLYKKLSKDKKDRFEKHHAEHKKHLDDKMHKAMAMAAQARAAEKGQAGTGMAGPGVGGAQ